MAETSSIVSMLGGGSGIDMAALATNLATAQFALRAERLTAKSEVLDRQISAASSLKNTLSLFAGALGDRVRSGDLAVTPQISQPGVASATSPAGTAGKGSYQLEVTQLAMRQVLAGPPMANATDPVGEGTLTIRFGTVGTGSFSADGTRAQVDIAVPAGATLADLAALVSGSGAGLTAYVAQTVDGARLVIKGPEGAASGFTVESTASLAALAWEPGSGDAARLLQSAQDALFELDGLPMRSATNATAQVAPGLQLQLTGTNAGNPATIGFTRPNGAISGAMGDIVGALNEIMMALNAATDPLTGDLARDPGARGLKRALSQLGGTVVMPNAAADAPRTLSDLGLAIQRDGTFRLDTARLQATLDRDPAGVAAMFTTGLYGVYATIDKVARNASRTGDPGTLGGSITRYQKKSAEVAGDAADLAEQQERLRAQMVARFARTDTRVGQSRSTLSFLQGQIDAWNRSRD